MYYYAKLNENQICTQIITRARELPKDLDGYVKIADYNETLLWRKYNNETGWTEERYEPSIEVELQERLEELEMENQQLKNEITQLNNTINILNGSIIELTQLIANLTGGAE